MKFENKILKIINEELKGIETEINTHALQRLEGRLNLMGANGDITPRETNFTVVKSMRTIIVKSKRNSLSIFPGVIF